MYNEDTTWINQNIYNYMDNECGTNSSVDITLSSKSTDLINFEAPHLSIRISNKPSNTSHTSRLNYQQITDIVCGCEDIIKNPQLAFQQQAKVIRRYNKQDFVLMFVTNDKGDYVLIGIKNNENDAGKIIVKYIDFLGIIDLLKSFITNYLILSMELPKRCPNSKIVDRLLAIERAIQILPSNMPTGPSVQDTSNSIENYPDELITSDEPSLTGDKCSLCGEPQLNTPSGVTCKNGHGGAPSLEEDSSGSATEFEQFVEDNIDKAKIPEMDQIEHEVNEDKTSLDPPQKEYDSTFIYKVLHGKCKNYEAIINSIYHESGVPTLKFIELIKDKMNIHQYLPGITKVEKKSMAYISKVLFKTSFLYYLDTGSPITEEIPYTIKYKPTESTIENIEFSYDLLTINAYIHSMRKKLMGKITDSVSNHSVLYLSSRLFTDILSYSFVSDMNPEVIKNCILSRFKSYKSTGFFYDFEQVLLINELDQITEKDISVSMDLFISKGIGNGMGILDFHKKCFDKAKFRIPSENKYTLEQMSNEIADLEVNRQLKRPLEDVTNDEELIAVFKKPKAPKFDKPEKEAKVTYSSNLQRLVNEVDFKTQIPERHQEEFNKMIQECSDSKSDFDCFGNIPLEELGDDVVKAIYIWNTSDKNMRYTSYRALHEDCMEKDMIIAQVKGTRNLKDETGSVGDWAALQM